jgi:flagellar assembly protein FliH
MLEPAAALRRFIPPAVAALGDGPEADRAQALARGREEGYQEGYAAGRTDGHAAGVAEGRAGAEQEAAVTIAELRARCLEAAAPGVVAAALREALDTQGQAMAALEAAAMAAIDAALHCLFPVLLSHAAGMEVAAVARDALATRSGALLTLRAAPTTLTAAGAELADATASGQLILRPDPALPDGAAAVSWEGGGLDFDPHDLLRRVRATLCPCEERPT